MPTLFFNEQGEIYEAYDDNGDLMSPQQAASDMDRSTSEDYGSANNQAE